MPRYEYTCKTCIDQETKGPLTFDIFLSVSEFEQYNTPQCPECGEQLQINYGIGAINWKCSGGTGASL